jgi:putative peptidoglycan lipid II flippase
VARSELRAEGARGLALGTLIGGALQLGVQLPSLRRVGYHFRPDFDWKDEGVRTILRTMGPAIIAASSVQVNVMVNTWFASWMETARRIGCIAFRLMQLPLGLFGVAIGTVTLPLLSRIARPAIAGNSARCSDAGCGWPLCSRCRRRWA